MYLCWDKKIIHDISDSTITSLYENGYLFTRQEKGSMDQTRSVRINIAAYTSSSENRRIMRKTEQLEFSTIPLPDPTYHWSMGKLAKDFYDKKFGDGVFSANKAKELMSDETKSNFNMAFVFRHGVDIFGYALCYEQKDMLHYSYPFYDLAVAEEHKNIGMGMMIRAVRYAEQKGKKYIYLGSAQRPTDTYKFQFSGMEWFDGTSWNTDFDKLKQLLREV
jgi:arginyl-tRNA--protein-N-Asp/Glu arginylyltransferase